MTPLARHVRGFVAVAALAFAASLAPASGAQDATPAQEATPAGSPAATLAFDRIEEETAALRELSITTNIEEVIVDSARIRAELEEEFRADRIAEELAAAGRAYEAFGLIAPGTDLGVLYLDLLAEQIAGRYFPDTGQLYVVADPGAELGAVEESTYAHEVVHALQDQQLGLDDLFVRYEAAEADEALAVAALIEGDASVAQGAYVQARPDLLAEIQAAVEGGTINVEVLERTPPILAQTLLFPYFGGAEFVAALLQGGGWDAVNAAYADPPTTTEQVLHPERYLDRDEPTAVALPDLAAAFDPGWQPVAENVFGEYQTLVLLVGDASEPAPETREAAAGWDGDRYQVWANGDEEAIAWQTVWDSEADAAAFAAALQAADADAFGTPTPGGATALIAQAGAAVGYVRAPTADLAAALQALLLTSPPATPAATSAS